MGSCRLQGKKTLASLGFLRRPRKIFDFPNFYNSLARPRRAPGGEARAAVASRGARVRAASLDRHSIAKMSACKHRDLTEAKNENAKYKMTNTD